MTPVRLTGSGPVAEQLAHIRRRSATLASTLGYRAVAKALRSGGPIEPNLRLIRDTIWQRRFHVPLNEANRRHNAKVDALRDGLTSVMNRVRELGGG